MAERSQAAGRPRESIFAARWILWVTTPPILLVFLLVWKAYVILLDVSILIVPPPERVAQETPSLLGSAYLRQHIGVTLDETFLG